MPEVKDEPKAKKSAKATAVWHKFDAAMAAMKAALIERDEEVELVLASLIAREHPLLVGPPGTAKSLLLDSVGRWMGTGVFSVLMSKHTTPEELFGPVSVVGLKNDQYRRITTGMMPEADLAFIDEIFKSSSATLNTLLRLLNERTFVNGDGVHRPCPLTVCLAASNEWPDAKELGALFDRFLIRKSVKPIRSPQGRVNLLFAAKAHLPVFADTISRAELDLAHETARSLPWAKEAKEGFIDVLDKLNSEGVHPGDRRIFKSRDAVRAWAWLFGADEVELEHLEVLKHTLWDDPAEQPDVCAKVVGRVANPTGFLVGEQLAAARDVVQNSNPTDAVSKLKQIRKALEKHGTKSPRVQSAISEVSAMIKTAYDKVVGEDDE
jgi:MoxR-like ATPase